MNKTFDKSSILQIEDYFILVENPIRDGATINIQDGGLFDGFKKHSKIIASIGKRIGDVPLIELPIVYIDDEIDEFAKEIGANLQEKQRSILRDFITYNQINKANKGKYSEAQVLNMLWALMDWNEKEAKHWLKNNYSETKRPIKVVLEYGEPFNPLKIGHYKGRDVLKVSEGNIIKPLNIEYE